MQVRDRSIVDGFCEKVLQSVYGLLIDLLHVDHYIQFIKAADLFI